MDNYIILITGLPAAGKTTFSEYLSKKLGVQCLNKDYIKENLCDSIGFLNREENKRLSVATYYVMKHVAERSMLVKKPIIMESNFTPDEGLEMAELIQKYGYDKITVLFNADMQVLYDRYSERLKSPTRHAAHLTASLDTFEVFRDSLQPLAEFDIGGKKLNVDTTSFDKVDYPELLEKIKELIQQT